MSSPDIEALLKAVERKESGALDRLFIAVYDDLRRLARVQRRARHPQGTLSTTALVHEAYLKLAGRTGLSWHNRVHFFATAAKVVRHVLASYAEYRNAQKRGGGVPIVPFEDHLFIDDSSTEEALAIHEAIARLESQQPRLGQVLECRIFGGLTVEETAAALSISPATVKRDWAAATTWLYERLVVTSDPSPDSHEQS